MTRDGGFSGGIGTAETGITTETTIMDMGMPMDMRSMVIVTRAVKGGTRWRRP